MPTRVSRCQRCTGIMGLIGLDKSDGTKNHSKHQTYARKPYPGATPRFPWLQKNIGPLGVTPAVTSERCGQAPPGPKPQRPLRASRLPLKSRVASHKTIAKRPSRNSILPRSHDEPLVRELPRPS
jgi:hypothetical protein